MAEAMYRFEKTSEHSICSGDYETVVGLYTNAVLDGEKPGHIEVLTDNGWVAISDPSICKFCWTSLNEGDHSQCHEIEHGDWVEMVSLQKSLLAEL